MLLPIFLVFPHSWEKTLNKRKCYQFILSKSSKEYKDIETAFKKTAGNEIINIKRIQNREIYKLYNVNREEMMKEYGKNFEVKELMLFHGTSSEGIENINVDGLNKFNAGKPGKRSGCILRIHTDVQLGIFRDRTLFDVSIRTCIFLADTTELYIYSSVAETNARFNKELRK